MNDLARRDSGGSAHCVGRIDIRHSILCPVLSASAPKSSHGAPVAWRQNETIDVAERCVFSGCFAGLFYDLSASWTQNCTSPFRAHYCTESGVVAVCLFELCLIMSRNLHYGE